MFWSTSGYNTALITLNDYIIKAVRCRLLETGSTMAVSIKDYQRVIGSDSNLDEINMSLGAAVKERFHLENGNVNRDPKSKLIRSYTEHTRR